MMRAPMSRMDVLTESEIEASIAKSKLAKKYNEVVDRESAYEIIKKKIAEAQEVKAAEQEAEKPTRKAKEEPSTAEVVGKINYQSSYKCYFYSRCFWNF
jgi:outer membrane translocation and assembly module TamA